MPIQARRDFCENPSESTAMGSNGKCAVDSGNVRTLQVRTAGQENGWNLSERGFLQPRFAKAEAQPKLHPCSWNAFEFAGFRERRTYYAARHAPVRHPEFVKKA
jgi:hypothetical protein